MARAGARSGSMGQRRALALMLIRAGAARCAQPFRCDGGNAV
jgi:hypothetical protein